MTHAPYATLCSLLVAVTLAGAGCMDEETPGVAGRPGVGGAPSVATATVAPVSDHAGEDLSTVRGAVTDTELQPVPNATVSFADFKVGVRTGPDGLFEFEGVPAGKRIIDVYSAGYEAMARVVDVNAPVVEVRLVLSRLVAEETPYVLVIPQEYFLNISFTVPHQAHGVVQTLNLPDVCGKCRAFVRFDDEPQSWIVETSWQRSNAANGAQIWVNYAYQNVSSGKGTGWSRGGYTMTNLDKRDMGDLTYLRSTNATSMHLNVSAAQFSFQHRLTLWVTFGYVAVLPPEYSAIPRS